MQDALHYVHVEDLQADVSVQPADEVSDVAQCFHVARSYPPAMTVAIRLRTLPTVCQEYCRHEGQRMLQPELTVHGD